MPAELVIAMAGPLPLEDLVALSHASFGLRQVLTPVIDNLPAAARVTTTKDVVAVLGDPTNPAPGTLRTVEGSHRVAMLNLLIGRIGNLPRDERFGVFVRLDWEVTNAFPLDQRAGLRAALGQQIDKLPAGLQENARALIS